MKYKIIAIVIGFLIVMIFGMKSFIESDKNAMKRESDRQNKILSHIGEQVIISKDTLIITDVNFWRNTYILSNKHEISIAFVIK